MRDVLPTMKRWAEAGTPFALARVVSTWGSAPRSPGSAMVISVYGHVAGSVSGGCIEGAVISEASEALKDGRRRHCTYGVDSATAWSVGLSCGGQVSVLVQPFDAASGPGKRWMEALDRGDPLTIRTPLGQGEETVGAPAGDDTTGVEDDHFVHHIPRPARLLIIGGADIAVHLTAMANRLDFEVTIVDPRAVFTDAERFDSQPAKLLTAWPQEVLPTFKPDDQTYAVLLTHDPRIDDPALRILLAAPTRYIGALGGRKTQKARTERMIRDGFGPQDLARIRGPVGLDLGASGPAEIATSIAAELVAVRRGKS